MELFLQEYEKLRTLGEGSFATIYKVRHKNLGYIRAIKVSNKMVDNEQDKAYQTFLKECKVLLKLGNGCHPNIVRIYQPRQIQNHALVEMDYVEGCTLHEYLQKKRFVPIENVRVPYRNIVTPVARNRILGFRLASDSK
jgi:serine/threonine protein kinase